MNGFGCWLQCFTNSSTLRLRSATESNDPHRIAVDDAEADALLRKLESLEWRPQNGFLKDEVDSRREQLEERADRAA